MSPKNCTPDRNNTGFLAQKWRTEYKEILPKPYLLLFSMNGLVFPRRCCKLWTKSKVKKGTCCLNTGILTERITNKLGSELGKTPKIEGNSQNPRASLALSFVFPILRFFLQNQIAAFIFNKISPSKPKSQLPQNHQNLQTCYFH